MKDRRGHADKISFDLGNNGWHRPSGLGGRLIVVIRQADEALAVYNNL